MHNHTKRILFFGLVGGLTVIGAQLPPEFMMGRYLMCAEPLMAGEGRETALEIMDKVIGLQNEHGLALPQQFHFTNAQVRLTIGQVPTGLASLTRYSETVLRSGKSYRAAHELLDEAEQIREELRTTEWSNSVGMKFQNSSRRLQGKASSGLNRRLEAQSLNQPVLVVESAKLLQCPDQFRYGLEAPGTQQLFLERPEETFNTAIAFRLANKRRRRLDPQEGELVLEVVAHELGGMIVPELEPLSSAGLKPSEVLMDALAEGFQRLEARGELDGMNAYALGRAMVHRGLRLRNSMG